MTPAEEVKALADLHKLKEKRYGKAKAGRDDGWSLKDTGEITNKSKSMVHNDLKLAEALEEFPELSKLKTKSEIKKAVNKMDEITAREVRLSAFEKELAGTELVSLVNKACIKESAFDYMPKLPDNSIYLTIADPPYGINIDKNQISMGGNTGGNNTAGFTFSDSREYASKCYAHIASESYRYTEPSGHIYVFFAPELFELVYTSFIGRGWLGNFRPIIWIKGESGQNNQPRIWPSAAYEMCFYFRKKESRLTELSMGWPDWVQEQRVHPTKRKHPTEKPNALIRNLINRVDKIQNKKFFDPFFGSGVCLEAATQSGMFASGCEIGDEAYNIGKERVIEALKWRQQCAKGKENRKYE